MPALPTTYVSPTELTATLDPAGHAVGIEQLDVVQASGASAPVPFEFTGVVVPPPPVVTGTLATNGTIYSVINVADPFPVFAKPPTGSTVTISINGTVVGPYTQSVLVQAGDCVISEEQSDPSIFHEVDVNAVDHTAELASLVNTTIELTWTVA